MALTPHEGLGDVPLGIEGPLHCQVEDRYAAGDAPLAAAAFHCIDVAATNVGEGRRDSRADSTPYRR